MLFFPFLYNLARCVLWQINRIASANLNSRLSLSVFCICQLYFACWGGSHCESPQHDVRYRSQNDVAALLETIASVEQRKWSFSRACTILNISKCLLIQTRDFFGSLKPFNSWRLIKFGGLINHLARRIDFFLNIHKKTPKILLSIPKEQGKVN